MCCIHMYLTRKRWRVSDTVKLTENDIPRLERCINAAYQSPGNRPRHLINCPYLGFTV